jgi:hypothetical protein
MLRLLWKNNIPQPLVTEEEVRLLLEQGRDRGDRGEEKAMIKKVIRLGDERISTL